MIRITISKSTGMVTHTIREKDGKEQSIEIKGLPQEADLKAILARIKALGLKEKE